MNDHDYLSIATAAIDALIEAATPYDGMFPSIIDRDQHRMLDELPAHLPGQRDNDRSHRGSNLMHDHITLHLMSELARTEGRGDYADAVDRYLTRFAAVCTNTPTGLFAWGEHAYWQLIDHRVGNSYHLCAWDEQLIHDHLRQAPIWLWQRLWSIDRACVERFADGLDWHWKDDARTEYMRHAPIEGGKRMGSLDSDRSFDFPRHGGFYILDLSFVVANTADDPLRRRSLEQIQRFVDYWWPLRSKTGLLKSESRTLSDEHAKHRRLVVTQTLSLALSLIESADVLAPTDAEMAQTCRDRGSVYLHAALEAGHRYDEHFFVGSCRDDLSDPQAMPIWGSVYGISNVGAPALLMLQAWRLTGDERCRSYAEAAGEALAVTPFPAEGVVPSRDPGHALCLLAGLHRFTHDDRWLRYAEQLAAAVVPIYFDKPLPRAANVADWYESQTIPGFLLYGLAMLGQARHDGDKIELETSSHF